jgi:LPXTG-site transpeptidase (sortase) family protein
MKLINFNLNNLKTKKIIYFVVVMFGVFGLTFGVLSLVGLVPKTLKVENIIRDADLPKNKEVVVEGSTRPDRVIIEKIGIDVKVLQPSSVNVAVLDETLKKGAAYYPGSGTIEKGNIFIFGHSTNWPVVQNPSYKTFNGLNKLVKGDVIVLGAGDQEFSYKVKTVELVDAENALVEFDNSGQILTLSTCNTFGEKQERWVVVAEKM